MRAKLFEKVAKAGAKVARAQLKLDLAVKELEQARKDVLDITRTGGYTVRLRQLVPQAKIPVIKTVREITHMGLKEAKELCDLTEQGQKPVLASGVDYETANFIKEKISCAGGEVEIK